MTYRDLCRALIYSSLDPENCQMYWIEDELDKESIFGEIVFEDGGDAWELSKDDEFACISVDPKDLPAKLHKLDFIHIEAADGITWCVFPLTD